MRAAPRPKHQDVQIDLLETEAVAVDEASACIDRCFSTPSLDSWLEMKPCDVAIAADMKEYSSVSPRSMASVISSRSLIKGTSPTVEVVEEQLQFAMERPLTEESLAADQHKQRWPMLPSVGTWLHVVPVKRTEAFAAVLEAVPQEEHLVATLNGKDKEAALPELPLFADKKGMLDVDIDGLSPSTCGTESPISCAPETPCSVVV